jgi:hypothetical protein
LITTPLNTVLQLLPFVLRYCTVKPLGDTFPTVGKQLLLEYELPPRSRTLSVMITFVPAGNALLNVTAVADELPFDALFI